MLEATVHTRRRTPQYATELLDQIAKCRSFPAVLETTLDVEGFDWLQQQSDGCKLVWQDRGASQTTFGLGVARRVVAQPHESATSVIAQCRQALQGLTNQRLYGGFAFRPDANTSHSAWKAFGSGLFWLPRVTLSEGILRLVVTNFDDVSTATRFVEGLVDVDSSTSTAGFPRWTRRVDRPDREAWTECIENAMQLFADEVLEKIVLARQVDFEFDAPLNPLALLRRLTEATRACYHFCFQTAPHHAFVGATPERLFWRKGRELLSEVVAGTRPRGLDAADDNRLGQELLASSKDQLEHDIVRKSIRQRLHSCVQRLEVDARASLLRLATKQHLYSRVTAHLQDGIDDGALLERLHPTPAVGGYPTENALDEIRRLEIFERGWYAAPVGWIGTDDAEFAVAIRSGLVDQQRLSLFSGAGIVPGSTAAAEWDEIEQKISDFLRVLPAPRSASVVPSP